MTSFNITGFSSTVQALVDGEVGFISRLGSLVTTGTAVTMSGGTLNNTGEVFTTGTAVVLTAPVNILNSGTMSATGGFGVLYGSNSTVSTSYLRLTNTGAILGVGAGTDGILAETGGNRIINHGTISSAEDDAIQIFSGSASGAGNLVVNSGTISGFTGLEITNDGVDRIINTGLIAGQEGSFAIALGGAGGDRLVNSGRIVGAVLLGGGNDTLDARGGEINGVVEGGTGDDLYLIDSDAIEIEEFLAGGTDTVRAWVDYELTGEVEVLVMQGSAVLGGGNASANTITGNAAGNLIFGDADNDTLSGLGGHDSIEGETGNDSILGGRGNDTLLGGVGLDTISGDDGNDLIEGGDNNDQISGGAGNDTIIGGLGADRLSGNAGADVFVYTAISDSTTTASGRDQISGFTTGVDRIDLSAIDANVATLANNAFVQVGAFTGTAGQLVIRSAGGNGFIEGDVNGDGTADFSIMVVGVTSFEVADIIL